VCVFISEIGHECGVAFVSSAEDGRFVLDYSLGGPHWGFGDQGLELEYLSVPNAIDRDRIAVRCPGCERRAYILFFKGHWACPTCHKLVYRSQLVDRDTRLWEERDALRGRVGKHRPPGMHNATYAKLLERLRDLDKALRGKGFRYASQAHSYLVRSEWRRPDDLAVSFTGYSRFAVINGQPCVTRSKVLPWEPRL
jgi:hypothetical protein